MAAHHPGPSAHPIHQIRVRADRTMPAARRPTSPIGGYRPTVPHLSANALSSQKRGESSNRAQNPRLIRNSQSPTDPRSEAPIQLLGLVTTMNAAHSYPDRQTVGYYRAR